MHYQRCFNVFSTNNHISKYIVKISLNKRYFRPTPCEKILGAWINQDLNGSEHLTTRLIALNMVGKVASLQTRIKFVDGIFISKLSDLICVERL